ncbi:MAG TPA: carboxypeptidase regulatory-like domain-containing protein [Desulfuromonadales bacterium]|nr:carboxypeptidase regulatory-like domain-containing protein [Desulfuromonadales bacterium]
MKKLISTGLVAATLLAAATSSWAISFPVFVKGTVLDAQGVGVSGAAVNCTPASGIGYAKTTTIPGGLFLLNLLPGSIWVCKATYAGKQGSKVINVPYAGGSVMTTTIKLQ